MRKIYVASSWRNKLQPRVVKMLREAGHVVYDFRNPAPGYFGFQWSEIDPLWEEWSPTGFIQGLDHPIAEKGFGHDMTALLECDACVLVLPCGHSSHLEAGWAAGAGKKVYILMPHPENPELMYKMTDGIFTDMDGLLAALGASK